MECFDITFDRPAENLACDEVLLDAVESGRMDEALRFWESPSHFVVLGVSQVLAVEVDEAACARDSVPILRRASAGGCVLQGPGSLNFSLIVRRDSHPSLATIRNSYCHLLGRVCRALATLDIRAQHAGISDLAVGELKVSGNAQKRRRNAILHHGTLVHSLDLARVRRYLHEPVDRPEYRGDRNHDAFMAALPAHAEQLRHAVWHEFAPDTPISTALDPAYLEPIQALAQDKYAAESWIRRR